MRGYKLLLPLFFIFISFPLLAIEKAPWFGNVFEFEWRNHFHYEQFNALNSEKGNFLYHAHNRYYGTSLALTPWPSWNVEFEANTARTKDHEYRFESFLLSIRKQLLDDIAGDFLTLNTGILFSIPNTSFLHDFSTPYYHGNLNVELNAAFGKEWAFCCDDWFTRLWAYAGYGFANKGSPWTHEKVMGEINIADRHQFGIFAEGLFGLGNNDLNPLDFNGYRSLSHQSIDLGGLYRLIIDYFGSLTLEYSYRVHAQNCPEEVHTIKATLLYTFGL